MLNVQSTGQGDNRVLASVYNMTASTLANGAVVAYYTSAAGVCDGFSVTVPTANYLDLVAGIVCSNDRGDVTNGISTLTAGFICTYGVVYNAAYYAAASDNYLSICGMKCVPVAGQTYLTWVAVGDGRDGFFVNLSTYASSTGAKSRSISVFIRAM